MFNEISFNMKCIFSKKKQQNPTNVSLPLDGEGPISLLLKTGFC